MEFLKGKIVAITGGSEGIGKALVELALQSGAKVATCSRNHDKLYQLQTQYAGKPLHVEVADVSKEADCKHFIDSTIKFFGGIDILINNAGISMRAELKEADAAVIKKVMDINFFGTVYCTRFALDSIISRKGTIVGVSSVAGYRGLPGRTGYNASKFAMQGFLEALRVEMMHTGVNVMWVCPGFTASNIRNAALQKDGSSQGFSTLDESKLMTAEQCASITFAAIGKRKRTLVYTFEDKRTIFLTKFFPKLTDKLVYKFFYKNNELVK
ncbi:MAG TPA: SDR family oxidoreductase [Lacibacter sp.]|nr:SDR family oxidoreductase [Lacibacter sp.]